MSTHETCLHEDRWTAVEKAMTDFGKGQENLQTSVDALNNRLYRDNGAPSMQSRLLRLEGITRIVVWVAAIAGTTVIGQGIMRLMLLLGTNGATP